MTHTLHNHFPNLCRSLVGLYSILVGGNIVIWGWALYTFRDHPVLFGSAFLAYSFGLHHAVDADHIAAIDNVTRKLMQEGKRAVTVGFWFSLGHSAVVALTAAAITPIATGLAAQPDTMKNIGVVIGASVSTLFLFVIAVINIVILVGILRTMRNVRRGDTFIDQDFDLLLNGRGLPAQLFRPLFALITTSWHMLPLGFLFGLGFDTATEVAMLGISATQAGQGTPTWSIMVFPALFAAGMSLIDTTDCVLMLGAYNWAFLRPRRKLYYNFVITAASVVVAVLIGIIEGLGLIGDQLGPEGWFWDAIRALNDNFAGLGLSVIALFMVAWVASLIIYRYTYRYEVETTTNS